MVTCTYSKLIGEQIMITAGQAYKYKKYIATEKLDKAIKESAEAGYSYLTIVNTTEYNDVPEVLTDKIVYESMYEDGLKDMLEHLGYSVEMDYDTNYFVSWKKD